MKKCSKNLLLINNANEFLCSRIIKNYYLLKLPILFPNDTSGFKDLKFGSYSRDNSKPVLLIKFQFYSEN